MENVCNVFLSEKDDKALCSIMHYLLKTHRTKSRKSYSQVVIYLLVVKLQKLKILLFGKFALIKIKPHFYMQNKIRQLDIAYCFSKA